MISEGSKLPAASLQMMGANGPEAVDLAAKLKGRKVVIFGLPGAYTGTCTTAHVPSFIRTKEKFAAVLACHSAVKRKYDIKNYSCSCGKFVKPGRQPAKRDKFK